MFTQALQFTDDDFRDEGLAGGGGKGDEDEDGGVGDGKRKPAGGRGTCSHLCDGKCDDLSGITRLLIFFTHCYKVPQ